MDFKEMYAQKKMTAEQAAALVKSGDWVDYGWCVATVVELDKALAARAAELTDVKLRGGILLWVPQVFQVEDAASHFTWNSWHMGGLERKWINEGFSFYAPIRYSELPSYYRDYLPETDVVMMQVAPMDAHGYFNFGPSASHTAAMLEKAKCVIVEVNENMPRCLGGFEEGIHISKVDILRFSPVYTTSVCNVCAVKFLVCLHFIVCKQVPYHSGILYSVSCSAIFPHIFINTHILLFLV